MSRRAREGDAGGGRPPKAARSARSAQALKTTRPGLALTLISKMRGRGGLRVTDAAAEYIQNGGVVHDAGEAYAIVEWWLGLREGGLELDVAPERNPLDAKGVLYNVRRMVERLKAIAQTAARFTRHWIQDALDVESQQEDGSLLARVKMPELAPIFGHLNGVLVTALQVRDVSLYELAADPSRHPIMALTADFFKGFYLRDLTTGWPRVATPHFAATVDAFVAPHYDPLRGEFVRANARDASVYFYTIGERADYTLEDVIQNAEHPFWMALDDVGRLRRLAVWFAQVAQARDAATLLLGFVRHGALDARNVMLVDLAADRKRAGEGDDAVSLFEDRTWAYRGRAARDPRDMLYLTAADHGNEMIKLVDFSTSSFLPPYEMLRNPELLEHGFAADLITLAKSLEARFLALGTASGEILASAMRDTVAWLASKHPLLDDGWRRLPLIEAARFVGHQRADFDRLIAAPSDVTASPPIIVATIPGGANDDAGLVDLAGCCGHCGTACEMDICEHIRAGTFDIL